MIRVLLLLLLCTGLHIAAGVTIGYGKDFDIPVPADSPDASDFFDKAAKAMEPKGGSIVIGPGTFILGRQFRIQANNVKIQGAGMGKTVLKLKNKAAPFKNAGFFVSSKTENGLMTDLTLDGNRANQLNDTVSIYGRFGVFIAAYKNWRFQRVECQYFQEYGFDPHGIKKKINGVFDYKTSQTSFGLVIEDCLSHDNGWDGITVDQTVGVLVRNNRAWNNGRHGINIVTASANVIVENNVVWNNGFNPPNKLACGLLADTNQPGFVTKNVVFRNNQVTKQSGTGGACVKGAINVTFSNNTISESVSCATFIQNAKGVKFVRNACVKNQADFLYQQGGKKPVLIGNTFKR